MRHSTAQKRDDWDRHWTDFADRATQNPAQAMRRRVIQSLLGVVGGGAPSMPVAWSSPVPVVSAFSSM